jgi:rhamnogalacturonyl hydrolase YesR
MMARVIQSQQPDGLWRASLLDPDAYPGGEASGSGFYTYALAWGINNGVLDKKIYGPVVRKAWIGMTTLLAADGHVGWVQPIGQDPRRDFSPDSWEVYGTGAFLLAGSEVIKLK